MDVLPTQKILPPRVVGACGPVQLFDVLEEQLSVRPPVLVAIHGQGLTAALDSIAAWCRERGRYIVLHDAPATNASLPGPHGELTIACGRSKQAALELQLCNWGRDELIEYLVRYHPSECRRVMEQLAIEDVSFADGSPYVWQPFLEALAFGTVSCSIREFVVNEFSAVLPDSRGLAALADELLDELGSEPLNHPSKSAVRQQLPTGLRRWLRLADVRDALMIERLREHVLQHRRSMLKRRWPPALLKQVAEDIAAGRLVQPSAEANRGRDRLVRFLDRSATKCRYSATAASLLVHLQKEWKPEAKRFVDLAFCDFDEVSWSRCKLPGASLIGSRLCYADLSNAHLERTRLHRARFDHAQLQRASLKGCEGTECGFSRSDLSAADLSNCTFDIVDFSEALMVKALLSNGVFRNACLRQVDLRGAVADAARFETVTFEGATLENASFVGARFKAAVFTDANLKEVDFSDARFAGELNWERLDLSGCNFARCKLTAAYLTDSSAIDASFRGADLRNTGLAGVIWEDCDLREADLRGAAFHMGSTRCGLVDSPYPSHGTRTGFYTDDYVDLSFKLPEQIRKAALLGCDLRGARITGCDFYLVDLRDCQLDPAQRRHAVSCGAIL